MLLRRITDFIFQGRLQAMAVVFLCAYIPLVSTVSILIAALVTLRKGAFEGLLVTIAAVLPLFLGYAIQPSGSAASVVGLVVASTFLTWALAILLRAYSNWSLILDSILLLGVGIIVLVHLFFPGIQEWWATQLTLYLKASVVADKPEITPEFLVAMVNIAKRYATGFVVISILFNAVLQLVLARWWQAIVFNPGGLRKELHQIRLSYVAAFVFVIAAILSYLGNMLALDIMPVIYGVFCAAGLSLLHNVFSLTKKAWLWLGFVYIGMVWLFPISVMMIAFIALLDSSVDIRKRLRKI